MKKFDADKAKIGDRVLCSECEGVIIHLNGPKKQPIIVFFDDENMECFPLDQSGLTCPLYLAPEKHYVNVYGDGSYDDYTTNSLKTAISCGNQTESYRFTAELVRVSND